MTTTEHITSRTVETVATTYGPKIAVIGGASAVVGGLTLTELLSIGGFLLALFGTIATIFFGWRKDRRESAEREERKQLLALQMAELKEDRRMGLPDAREDRIERRHAPHT